MLTVTDVKINEVVTTCVKSMRTIDRNINNNYSNTILLLPMFEYGCTRELCCLLSINTGARVYT